MSKPKIDLSVSRSATISLASYRSIKPTVMITAKNIDADKTSDVYDKMSKALDALWGLETLSLISEMSAIQTNGVTNYEAALRRAEGRMEEILERFGLELTTVMGNDETEATRLEPAGPDVYALR